MEKQLEQLYNKIAEHLDSMIPVKWDKIYLLGEVEKGQLSISSTFYFIESTTKHIVSWDDSKRQIIRVYEADDNSDIICV